MQNLDSKFPLSAAKIEVVEMPDGTYLAQVAGRPGLNADGATPEEAEEHVLDLLDIRKESKEMLHKETIAPDPDEVLCVGEG